MIVTALDEESGGGATVGRDLSCATALELASTSTLSSNLKTVTRFTRSARYKFVDKNCELWRGMPFGFSATTPFSLTLRTTRLFRSETNGGSTTDFAQYGFHPALPNERASWLVLLVPFFI
jgi:hypothetical protein